MRPEPVGLPWIGALFSAFFLVFCAVFAGPASAQSRDQVYVASVSVDVTAANAAEAQEQGFAQAERAAFGRVLRRITLAGDRAQLGEPRPEGVALQRLVARVDVEEERRSATRYIARLTVRMNPNNMRQFLQQAGFTVVETRAAPLLVLPVAASAPQADAWRRAWEQGGFAEELVALSIAPAAARANWDSLAPFAQAAGSATALVATLRISGDVVTADLAELTPSGAGATRGSTQARISGGDVNAALAVLAQQASDLIQDDWKATFASGASQPVRVSVSALFADRAEWDRVKQGLDAASRSLVSDVRVEAVAREGALVSFSYIGAQDALAAELRRSGILLESTPRGLVLRLARR